MTQMKEKVILITGASSGIGEAAVRELATTGAKLFLGARRTDRLEALATELGDHVAWHSLDVTDAVQFESFVAAALQRFGQIDVLVSNAGIMPLSPLNAAKQDEWKRMVDVNIHGVLNGIAATLPKFTAQGHGQFVNVASVGAHEVFYNSAVYSATKYAVLAISQGLQKEHDNIRSTIISPGVTDTELGHDITDEGVASLIPEWRKKSLHPSAVARAIRFAIEQPADVDINEIIIRPTAADM